MYYIIMYTKYINNISEIVATYKKNEKIRNEKSNAIIENCKHISNSTRNRKSFIHTYYIYVNLNVK